MRAHALIAILLTGQACAPAATPAPPPSAFKLDCSRTYEALSADVLALPDVKPAPRSPGEPYRYYSTPDGTLAFVFTEPGAPGHPAIIRQVAARKDGATVMENTGCPYGDRKGFDQLMTYLGGLDTR
ncbi:MAG: hypothetical protein V4759_15755 [Pseudomonadota bacterium]